MVTHQGSWQLIPSRPPRETMTLSCVYDSLMMPYISMTFPNQRTHTYLPVLLEDADKWLVVVLCMHIRSYFSAEVRSVPPRNEGRPLKVASAFKSDEKWNTIIYGFIYSLTLSQKPT